MEPKNFLTKTVWVVWSNTDLTEGRGTEFPLAVTEIYETALRLAKGKGVQGTNCPVTSEQAVKLQGTYHWLVPGRILPASKEDIASRDTSMRITRATEKALAAGLTMDDIQALKEGQ